MSYKILITRQAQKELAGLDVKSYSRIKKGIERLSKTPRPRLGKKLTGRDAWRIRSGDYRVIYEINDSEKTVTVLHIGHRRDIYR